ncbi:MAG TPA: 4Fe-4S dicluster domain-containing protein, partial [Albitalea sp.]|nr:4Fe-4S dicluster domain-containing protein [Albitalea sp.]
HALGVLVGTQEGRPIKIEGNPLHPSSLGATDVFAQASVLSLWDPDRSASVMQRLAPSSASAPHAQAASSWQAFEAAWQTQHATFTARQGKGLHVLTGPVSSPTLRAQLLALLQRFPLARWHQHAPLHDGAADEGARLAFGRTVQPVLHLDRATCIVALGSDPFSDGPGAVRHAADWSRRRAATRASGTMARLIAVETTPGLFGARAGERVALAPAQIDALCARIGARLLDHAPASEPADALSTIESRLVSALQSHGATSLIMPGPTLSPASHAMVHALNQRLGALGHTLELIAPLAMAPEAATLADLVDALHGGAVDTLLTLDANPLYDAPGAFDLAAALSKARLTVHAGTARDETALACDWHLPLSHDLEQWSDALAHDGSATLVQPAIAPLLDSRSLHELVALIAGDDERDGHRLVQRQWRAQAGADFDGFWRASLRRGVVDGSAAPPLALPAARRVAAAAPQPMPPGHLAAVFTPDPCVHDGRFANSGWLQELPRPLTKLTWDNAVLLGPATARSLALTTGDVARVSMGRREAEAPVVVLPSHAEGAVTLPLGHGRRAAGRVGNGVGVDFHALRPRVAMVAAVQLQRLARRVEFATTQIETSQAARALARMLAVGARIGDSGLDHPSLYPPPPRDGAHAWAMAIDLDSCIGCNACTVACQAENNIPVVGKHEVARGRVMHWIRVDRYDDAGVAGAIFQPVPCMHCENAPCELVCPVGATVHDSEGLNVQVYNRCIGTRFCSNNCPYKVRRFNFLQYTDAQTETLKGQRNPNVTVRQRGVMEKCSYCVQRIARARQHAEASGTALVDGDVVTACQAVCPTRAIHFGDLADPHSDVAQAKRSPRHYALLGELNTRPRTTYLARVRDEDAA